MADEPHDCGGKRSQKKQKHDPAFSTFFSQRTPSPGTPRFIERVCAVHRERDLKSFFGLIASHALFHLRSRCFLRNRTPLCNHALKPVELVTQLSLLSFYFLLLAAKWRTRFARTPKHCHHLLAIQKKNRRATAPKIISGRVSARPICNH